MPSIISATTTNGVAVQGDNSGSLQLQTNNGTTAVTIDTSQNVGVGTSSPTRRLEITGSSDSNALIQVNSSLTTAQSILGVTSGSDTGFVGTISNHNFVFRTNNTERMRITSGGYLKVSNDGTYVDVAGSVHELKSTGTGICTLVRATNASYANDVLLVGADRNTTNNSFYAFSYYNYGAAAYRFRIADSGNATNTNGSYGTISDIKLKENIVDATPKLDKVNQLKVRNYNFIGDELKQIGFVAQEFEQVFPSMVEESADKDADGNDLGTTTKTIKTTVLIPILVKAIQELKAQLDESNLILTSVKTELDATKAEVQALKGVA